MMKNLLPLLLLLSNIIIAQNPLAYKWDKTAVYESFPDSLKGDDAFNIFIHREDKTGFKGARLVTKKRIHKKMMINDLKAVSQLSDFNIHKAPNLEVYFFDARVIKKSGSVVNLKADNYKYQTIGTSSNGKRDYQLISLNIPSVEVGDQVEIICEYQSYSRFGGSIFLNDKLFSLKSSFKMTTFRNILNMSIYPHGDFPEPEVYKVGDMIAYTWTEKNVPGYGDDSFAVLSREFPYVDYAAVSSRMNPTVTYFELLRGAINRTDISFEGTGSNAFMKYFNTKILEEKPATMMDSIKLVQDFVLNDIEILPWSSERFFNSNFKKRAFPNNQLYGIYTRFFNYYKIPFEVLLCRDKYEGQMVGNFCSFTYLDYVGLKVRNSQGSVYYFGDSFYLNEVPVYIEGTECVRVKVINPLKPVQADNFNYNTTVLPLSKMKDNSVSLTALVKLGMDSVNYQIRESYVGRYSYRIRKELEDSLKPMLLNEDAYDTLFDVNKEKEDLDYPFRTQITYSIAADWKLNQLDSALYELELKDLFDFNFYDLEDKRSVDLYPLTMETQSVRLYIDLPADYSLIEPEKYVRSKNFHIGRFNFTVRQVSANKLMIDAKYELKDLIMKSTDFEDYKAIMKMAEDIKDLKLYLSAS